MANGQRDISLQMKVWHEHLWPSVPVLYIKATVFPPTGQGSSFLGWFPSSRSFPHIQYILYCALVTGHHLYRTTASCCLSDIGPFWNYIGNQTFPEGGENQICSCWNDDSELSVFYNTVKNGLHCSICHQLLIYTCFSLSLTCCRNNGILAF